jgi:ribosomal protein S18 acetylase RimI-like enzyme
LTEFSTPRPITANDDTSGFDCGRQPLNSWLQVRAIKNETAGASRTFISVERESGLIAGYYCLAASSLGLEDAPSRLARNMPSPIPIILIGRLAVDTRFGGMGLGASLLQDAILKGIEAARIVGARAFLVHAIDDSAQSFYERFGFALVPESERAMYLLASDAESTIQGLAG